MAGHSSRGGGAVHVAARSGDLEAVQAICLSNPTSVNVRDNHSRTPLHLAAWAGQIKVLQFLCEHKADVGATAIDNMAAIHFASQKGHLEIVRILLRSGAAVNSSTRKGMTALHYAVQGSHLDIVKLLIHKGASLNAETKARKKAVDLAKDDQIRLVLTTSGESVKGWKDSQKKSHEDSPSNNSEAKPNGVSVEIQEMVTTSQEGVAGVKSVRRGSEEGETIEQIGPQPKKAKVGLSHLLDDDTPQEEEC